MPRAPKIGPTDTQEFALSREYLQGALEPIVKSKLETHANGQWLVNKASNQTYAVYLVDKPHPQTGMVKVTFGLPGMIWNGELKWLILHDATSNKVYLIGYEHLITFLRNLVTNPQSAGGFCTVVREGPLSHVHIHLDWAISNNLVKLAAPIKGSYSSWREKKLAVKEDFVHLHCHSEFSLLDGASAID